MGAAMKCMRNSSSNDHVRPTHENGRTPLHHAVLKQQWGIVKILLDEGMDINQTDNAGKTALAYAKRKENKDLILLLMAHGADGPSLPENNTSTSYHSLWSGQWSLLEKLLDSDCDPNENFNHKYLPTRLHVATEYGCLEIVQKLIQQGAELNVFNSHGDSPLHIACRQGNYPIAKRLLERGARLTDRNHKRETPIFLAFKYGSFNICYLVIRAVRVQLTLKEIKAVRVSIVKAAIAARRDRFLTFVFEQEKKIKKHCIFPLEVIGQWLEYAINCRNWSALRILMEHIGETEPPCVNRRMVIHSAVLNHDPKALKILLQYHSMVNAKETVYLNTALHLAVKNDYKSMVRMLLQNTRIDVNARNHLGSTPLHEAVENHNWTLIKLLMQNGADIHAKDKLGRNVLYMAALTAAEYVTISRRLPRTSFVYRLIKMGAKLEGPYILQACVVRNSLATLRAMLEHDETNDWIKVEDGYCCNPLQTALQYQNQNIIDCLISHGANIRELQKVSSKIMSGSRAAIRAFDRFYVRMRIAGFEAKGQISEHGVAVEYVNKCKEEVVKMKRTNIRQNFTYYDLLTADQVTILKQLSDKKLQGIIQKYVHCKMFPIYADMIDRKLKIISRIGPIIDDIYKSLCAISKNEVPLETIEYLANFLKRQDFLNLIEAAKPIVKKS